MAKTKGGQRKPANLTESAALTVNERTLQECHRLYVDEERGLVRLGGELGLSLLAPRKKITVLLIGNHSAGKSSFINWYVEEHVQKTAVAIETQGFALVTSGRRRESLTGNATMKLYPQLQDLRELDGVVDYLSTEISTSKQKRFGLVTFIDTPGLVDGDMKYPFDVNEAIVWLGGIADLVVVFFDPIGQALCKRTLSIVERLNDKYPDRIRFFLSKADTAGLESDRQRVLMQITQELCKRPSLNKAGFKMPTIFIPSLTGKTPRCENQIDDLCDEIEKSINQNIQNSLNTLERDADDLSLRFTGKINNDRVVSLANMRAWCWGLFLRLLSFCLILAVSAPLAQKALEGLLGSGVPVTAYVAYCARGWEYVPLAYRFHVWVCCGIVALVIMIVAQRMSRTQPTMSRKQRRLLMDKHLYVDSYVKKKKTQLYDDYLKQSVASLDMP